MTWEGAELEAASERLARCYPHVVEDQLTELLRHAGDTVERLTGRPDAALAADLARLRLDVRTRGHFEFRDDRRIAG
jgi:hypothetical protein